MTLDSLFGARLNGYMDGKRKIFVVRHSIFALQQIFAFGMKRWMWWTSLYCALVWKIVIMNV